ncbi:MAG: D-aminoacyl-tRNA deacylase [Balneolales bacterium]
MKVVVQRVSQASVKVNNNITGKVGKGLLLLVAVHQNDEIEQMKWVADKIAKLRIFEDEDGKMNKSVLDVAGELLVVSQFTLYGDVKKGTRPSFIESARPEKAEDLYDKMVRYWEKTYNINVETGQFAAMMEVSLVNDGPVTLVIEKNSEVISDEV